MHYRCPFAPFGIPPPPTDNVNAPYLRLFSCARLLCHSHAVEMMSSSLVMCGLHCNSLAARAELLISRAGSPGRLSPNLTGTGKPRHTLGRRDHFADRITETIP